MVIIHPRIAIDSQYDPKLDDYFCCTHGGKKRTDKRVYDWVQEVESLGAGELLVTSMDFDGMKQGFDLKHLNGIAERVNIPIIASGGGGKARHFIELFTQTPVSAGLAASILHDKETTVHEIKQELENGGVPVRWP
ncbi:hypothetical protein JPSP40_05150 [Staphylococcus pseudintermedius]